MVDKSKDINVGGTLHSIATGNTIAHADEIMDEEWGAKLSVINLTLKDNISNTIEKSEDNTYPDMIVGGAVNLQGDTVLTHQCSYHPTGGDLDVNYEAALIESIKGNAVAWNQLCENKDYVRKHESSISHLVKTIETHKYAVYANIKTTADFDNQVDYVLGLGTGVSPYNAKDVKLSKSTTKNYSVIITATNVEKYDSAIITRRQMPIDDETFRLNNFQVFDLTLIYGSGKEPSTPEQFEEDYQRWFGRSLEYEPYDEGSIRSVLATGIKTVGFNLWPYGDFDGNGQQWMHKTIKNDMLYQGEWYIQYDSLIPIKDNTFVVSYIDGTSSYYSAGDETSFTHHSIKINASKIVKSISTTTGSLNGNFKLKNICINFSWSGKRDGDYESYWEETQALPITSLTSAGAVIFPDSLKRAGEIYDEIFVENGVTKAIKRVGSVDLGTLEWSYIQPQRYFYTRDIEEIKHSNEAAILCDRYSSVIWGNFVGNYENNRTKCISVYNNNNNTRYNILDDSYTDAATFKSAISGVILYYELAEPQTYIIDDFQLPVIYKIDDFGTEQIIMPENSIGPTLDTRYGINAVDTIRRLPKNYISSQSDNNFLSKLSSITGGKWNKLWDNQKDCYDYQYQTNGIAGQVLTKTDNGAEWQDAEAALPEGGKVGDALVKTSNGSEWKTLDYYTKTEADKKFLTEHQDLTDYATKQEVEDTYAKQEGYYPDLVAGTAANLEGKNDIINASMYRPTGGNYDVDSGVVSINSIQGNAVAWNQLVKNGNFVDTTGWVSSEDIILGASDNILTIKKIGDTTGYVRYHINTVSGHKYLASVDVKVDGDNPYIGRIGLQLLGNLKYVDPSRTKLWENLSFIYDSNNNIDVSQILLYNYSKESDGLQNVYYKNVQLFDLTLIYGAGNEPTTPEQFEADYQRWFGKPLEYEEYDEGSIRTVLATGIKTVGFNLYSGGDFEGTLNQWYNKGERILWENNCNYINTLCIQCDIKINNNTNKIYETTHINKVVKKISASYGSNTPYIFVLFDDSSFQYISLLGTSLSNNDIFSISNLCINFSWSGKRDGDYEPYWEETKELPITELTSNGEKIFPDGLKRAGSVYDEIFVENGVTKAVKRVGSVDLGIIKSATINNNRFIITFPNALNPVLSTKNILCDRYITVSASDTQNTNLGISIFNGSLYISNTSCETFEQLKQALQGVTLYYELAEPITYTIDNFQLPLAYKVDDFGTEEIVSPEDSVAPVLVTRYGINAVDSLRRLNSNYISVQSDDDFLNKLSSVTGGKWSKVWNEQKGRFDYNHEGDVNWSDGPFVKTESGGAQMDDCTASGKSAVAEGNNTQAIGDYSHAEGYNTTANYYYSHAEGSYTIALNSNEHASGIYNISLAGESYDEKTLFTVGNGETKDRRHNAFEIRHNGDIYIADTATDVSFYNKPMVHLQSAVIKLISKTTASGNLSLDGTKNIHIVTLNNNVSSITLSSMPQIGNEITVILYGNGTERIVAINSTEIYKTPTGESVEITVPAAGYAEINFLYDGSKIWVRGV